MLPPPPPVGGPPPPPPARAPRRQGLSFLAGFGLGCLAAILAGLVYLLGLVSLTLHAADTARGWEVVALIFIIGAFIPVFLVAGLLSSLLTGLVAWAAQVRSGWTAFWIGSGLMLVLVHSGLTMASMSIHESMPQEQTSELE